MHKEVAKNSSMKSPLEIIRRARNNVQWTRKHILLVSVLLLNIVSLANAFPKRSKNKWDYQWDRSGWYGNAHEQFKNKLILGMTGYKYNATHLFGALGEPFEDAIKAALEANGRPYQHWGVFVFVDATGLKAEDIGATFQFDEFKNKNVAVFLCDLMNKESKKASDLNLKRCYSFPNLKQENEAMGFLTERRVLRIEKPEKNVELTLGDFVKRFEHCKWTPGFHGKIGKSNYNKQIANGGENVFLCQDFATIALRSMKTNGQLLYMQGSPISEMLTDDRFDEQSEEARKERNKITGNGVYNQFGNFGHSYFIGINGKRSKLFQTLSLAAPKGFGSPPERPVKDWQERNGKRPGKCANCCKNVGLFQRSHTCRTCQRHIHNKCNGENPLTRKFWFDRFQSEQWVCNPCTVKYTWQEQSIPQL